MTMHPTPTQVMGMFVAVVGPSGAGKDTIIASLSQRLPPDRFFFPRRIITRHPDPTENSLYLSDDAFLSNKVAGEFLLTWEANQLHYAIPRVAGEELELGRHVIANVSRNVIPALRALLPRVLVVHVTAHKEILQERLQRRGRELSDMQLERLDRGLRLDAHVKADVRIENNGQPQEAVIALLNVLLPAPMAPSALSSPALSSL